MSDARFPYSILIMGKIIRQLVCFVFVLFSSFFVSGGPFFLPFVPLLTEKQKYIFVCITLINVIASDSIVCILCDVPFFKKMNFFNFHFVQ